MAFLSNRPITGATRNGRTPLLEALERRSLLSATLTGDATATAAALDQQTGASTVQQPLTVGGPAPVATRAARSEPSPRRGQQRAEVRYMQFTADHHMMGVEMATLGEQKASNAQLSAINTRIRQEQAAEIEQVRTFLRDWYGIDYQPEMSRRDERDMRRLESLQGEAFDVELSKMFIRHHRQIIAASQKALRQITHEELRTVAENVITKQTAEIEEFETVLESYGERVRHRHGR